jgi:ribulose 1,5-bisphosphate synthetase/thiazole synthase
MDYIIEPEKRTPVVADVDLLICGGGFAGVAAAVCAARNGVKPLLLENYGFLGGLVTAALVITTPPLDNGINKEISDRLREKSVYAPCRNSGEEVEWLQMHAMDPEIVKYELVRILQEHGVDLLLHTYIVDAIMEENLVKGIIMENKKGRMAVRAKMVVDATGDADIAAFAKAPTREVVKPMTMMYNMVGVDIDRVLEKLGNWGNLKKMVKEAMEKGELGFDLGIYPEFGAPGVHAEKLVYHDELNVWSGMLKGKSGIDPWDLTEAEILTREHVMRLSMWMKKNLPGFENSRIEYTSTQVGVRASRQIIGEAMPNMDEVKKIKFDDTVVKPYDVWDYRLPYGCILPQNVENLLVAGRCISAEEEAMGLLRLIPVCSATGQAAGTAAALALRQGVSPRKLEIPALQKTLQEQDMDLAL